MTDRLAIAWHFIRTRWLLGFVSREALLSWQAEQVGRFLESAGFPEDPPVIGKAAMRERFHEFNPSGIRLEEAESLALRAERDRDFSGTLANGVTVGLSSGTSGSRSVFLVTKEDRGRWAGIILARALSAESLRRLLSPWRPKLKIAFFLRADSNLYQTVGGSRIDFRFFDLLDPFPGLMARLTDFRPDILIAPATVLAAIAASGTSVKPSQVVSVAEVLDERDAKLVEEKFGVHPSQIYQATEGFIGATCREGRMHLNEEHLRIEEAWIDGPGGRFHPVITDFSRKGQYFVRYRLDDILVADNRPCPCGRVSRAVSKIEGRADEILRFGADVFPDTIRQTLYAMADPPENYRIEQHGDRLHLFLKPSDPALAGEVAKALGALFGRLGLPLPVFVSMPWSEQPAGEKQRRIRCVRPFLPS